MGRDRSSAFSIQASSPSLQGMGVPVQPAAVKRCRELGITPEQVIAFGDAENDISMLRLAGIGVAMGNGEPAAKEAADYVTDRIEADGIRKALERFGII